MLTGCIIRLFCSMLWWEKNSLFFFGPNWLDRQSIMLKPAVFNTIYSSLAAGPWVHVKVVQKTRQMAVQTTFGIGRGDDVGHTHSGLLSSAKDVLHKWQFHYLVDPPHFLMHDTLRPSKQARHTAASFLTGIFRSENFPHCAVPGDTISHEYLRDTSTKLLK